MTGDIHGLSLEYGLLKTEFKILTAESGLNRRESSSLMLLERIEINYQNT